MKRRNRMGHQRFARRSRKSLGQLAEGHQRKRRSWTFERLEDRLVFSLPTNDPMFAQQWHLLNTHQEVGVPDLQNLYAVAGQDINVTDAWNMVDANGNPINGKGVLVAVIDSGVQLFHPDLAANISPTLRFNAINGTNNVIPSLTDPQGGHGTAIAGIIGAVQDNGVGGVGVAPGVTIVPIKATLGTAGVTDQAAEDAIRYALEHKVDITNNSYGANGRRAVPITDTLTSLLRDAVINGRPGVDANGNPAKLGMINIFAAGNDAGPNSFAQGFPNPGNLNSASYNALINSRFTIGVTGVDHDGLYINSDGTFTSYPVTGASVLVAAPTGSIQPLGPNTVGEDAGFGSGIWTTDLFGDYGFNANPNPDGSDPDGDFWFDNNYTSRFSGTSASAAMVSGVVALMLQANPHLTFRDVEEILVRSSRQTAQFEYPTTGGLGSAFPTNNTWQVNQTGPFRSPDLIDNPNFNFNFDTDPIADPNSFPIFNSIGFPGGNNRLNYFAPDTNDSNRQFSSVYEPQPPVFTNGAGYTVSQGFGVYGEQLGYAHGVVDAKAAVQMALQWDQLKQNIFPNTERTYTTAVVEPGTAGFRLLAAEKGAAPPAGDRILVPGGIDGDPAGGFIAYWNQYFANPPFPATYRGPFAESRGASYIDFAVPPSQEMNVEWVEVKVDISGGGAAGLNGLRIMLVSPDGTQSELNNYYPSVSFLPAVTVQDSSSTANGWFLDPGSSINQTGGDFVWTFSTNRSWGENSSSQVIIHPVTGEPVMQDVETFDFNNPAPPVLTQVPIFRNWELHLENWSNQTMVLQAVEVIWHGKPIGGGTYDPNYGDNGILSAQRVQGLIGIDQNGDNAFNYNRYVQTLSGNHADVSDIRDSDVTRILDFNDNNHNGIYDEGDTINQEAFAANIVVDAYKVWGGVAEATPTASFLTGADGNYYFDLDVQGDLAQTKNPLSIHFGQTIEYRLGIRDPLGRQILNDIATPALVTTDPNFTYLPHYKSTWTINPNWFFAPDRDNGTLLGNNPGEIFYDASGTHIASYLLNPGDLPEPGLGAPLPFANNMTLAHIVPAPVKNLNFLLKEEPPANRFDVSGTVYSDVNGNGVVNPGDTPIPGFTVYWDRDGSGTFTNEPYAITDANGNYTLTVDLTTLIPPPTGKGNYNIGVVIPAGWTATDPVPVGLATVFAGAGSSMQHADFYLQPPNANPPGGSGPGTVQGTVFDDVNGNGIQDIGESGKAGFRVFLDVGLGLNFHNGILDPGEVYVDTGPGGTFFFNNVSAGVYWIDVVIPNEGTPVANWSIIQPAAGHREIQVFEGGSATGVNFALRNLADRDWGDLPQSALPASFHTTSAKGGPSHRIVAGFQLGNTNSGEVDGMPSPGATADASDDGVEVISNGGMILKNSVNTLRVTVQGVGGLLTGWMDFNNDGQFTESERLTWTLNGVNKGGEADLNPGTYDLQINVPNDAVDNRPIAARFRWGEHGLSFDGPAKIGEVEDYIFNFNFLLGDYDGDHVVGDNDYVVWRKTFGQHVTPYSGADGDGSGIIDQGDYDVWRNNFGNVLPAPAAAVFMTTAAESSASNPSASAAAATADASALLDGSIGAASGQSHGFLEPAAAAPPANVAGPTPAIATSVSTGAAISDSPLVAAFVADTSHSSGVASTSATLVQPTTVGTASSNSGLLLLDQAWADMDGTSYDHADESLYGDQSHDEVSTNDLALAAVLNEDDDWWGAI